MTPNTPNTAAPVIADKEGTRITCDDLTLQRHAALLPEEMREPFLWLGAYFRNKCQASLEILSDRAAQQRIELDRSTWSRILRGRLNRDTHGDPTPAPIVAYPRLLKFIDLLRALDRRSDLSGEIEFVWTPTAQSIKDYIFDKWSPGRINRYGVIVGHTGTQKTATFREVSRTNNHGRCVWRECPANGSIATFLTNLSEAYGGSTYDVASRARRRIIDTLKNSGSSRMIIIDNAQAAYKEAKDDQPRKQPLFDFLREIQEETRASIILSITPEFDERIVGKMVQGYFEQFEGRAGGRREFLRLPNYPTAEDCLCFGKAFALKNAEDHVDYLEEIAHQPGRVRILLEYLQKAKRFAKASGKGLTIDHLREAYEA